MKRISWLGGSMLILWALLAVYGLLSWFFPSESFVAIASAPVLVLGGYLTYVLCRMRDQRTYNYKQHGLRKSVLCFAAFFVLSGTLWTALLMGVPALVTNFLGPNAEISVKVTSKQEKYRRRSCDFKVTLDGFSTFLKSYICVLESNFRELTVGEDAILLVRKDIFGTRIFEIHAKTPASK